jgi:hypothetical protein
MNIEKWQEWVRQYEKTHPIIGVCDDDKWRRWGIDCSCIDYELFKTNQTQILLPNN